MGQTVKVVDLCMSYESLKVLDSINLSIGAGEFVSLLGTSGCGKSTLLELIGGLRMPTSGSIYIDGEQLQGPRQSTGIVFQEDTTLPWRNILDNVAFSQEVRGVKRAEARVAAKEAIRLVGLSGFENYKPAQLSGGMRQRVAFARILTTKPELILADEPFGALDEQTRLVMGTELTSIVGTAGATVLLVTHSIQEAILLSDRVLVMRGGPGKIVEEIMVDLPRPRTTALLGEPRTAALINRAWEPLKSASDSVLEHRAGN